MSEAAGPLLAGVELGGTKIIAVLARGRDIIARRSFATEAPDPTLARVRAQLDAWHAEEGFAALGIASFGPLQLDQSAAGFGRMLATPKPGWTGIDVAGVLSDGIPCPWAIDTDVNGAALAEQRWGAGEGCDSVCYLTIGTGIGGGLLIGGAPVHGAMHAEVGHIRIRRRPGDAFAGICPFHGDCLEGLVSGPALAARFGASMDEVGDDDPRWEDVVEDLAELMASLLLTVAAQRILIGGGVGIGRRALLPAVRARTLAKLGGYLPAYSESTIAQVIRTPALGADAGPLGAIALAHRASTGEIRAR